MYSRGCCRSEKEGGFPKRGFTYIILCNSFFVPLLLPLPLCGVWWVTDALCENHYHPIHLLVFLPKYSPCQWVSWPLSPSLECGALSCLGLLLFGMTTDKGQQLCLLCEWAHGRGEGWVSVTKIIDQQSHDNLMSNLSELHVKPLYNKVLFVVLSGCILCYRYCHISMQSAYVRTYAHSVLLVLCEAHPIGRWVLRAWPLNWPD